MSALESLKIASPCRADWSAMRGTEQVRHCDECSLSVYNISEMTRAEAEALIESREGRMCIRMYKRGDGTLITRDCPVGVARKRRRMTVVASIFTGLMGLGAAATAFAFRKPQQCPTANNPTSATQSTMSTLGDHQPFKTLAKWFPEMFPQTPPPQPVYTEMGDMI